MYELDKTEFISNIKYTKIVYKHRLETLNKILITFFLPKA